METDLLGLLNYEHQALLDALRRDLIVQSRLAMHDSDWAIWHRRNVQLNLRLLEVLNPKRQTFYKPSNKASAVGSKFTNDGGTEYSTSKNTH